VAGDAKRGAEVFVTYCLSCHGADGRGSKQASSIVDGSYLALVSDQYLRTTVIAGRREWGAPDWRSDLPGKPMSPEDVSDVVAWLSAQRSPFSGQPYTSSTQVKGEIR
jgi:mono/diheme cytochrome c family protein